MARAATPTTPVVLIFGEDEFAVKQRAKELYQKWCAELGGMDHEVIDASVGNSGDALKSLGKLREAIQTLPFFGGAKVVWFQNCNFLAEDRTSSSQAVTGNINDLAQELKAFKWENVRLLISAGKVDKRKTFYKTLEKLGEVEVFAGWSFDDKDWADQAEMFARGKFRDLNKQISDEALSELVANIGPNARMLDNEVEKLALYAGNRPAIGLEDVNAITTRNKHARAFALGDALGDRDLPRLLRCLDEELWEMRTDKDKSEIGLLYGLITKIRVLIFLKELIDSGMLKLSGGDPGYPRFKAQLENLPADLFPEDKKFNPLSMNAYVLYKALPQVKRYTRDELIRAMELLLQCNQQFFSSGIDATVALQQTLIKIAGKGATAASPVR
jgi:DNA polymerase-3 subunit delta